jgi:prepilin-type N-terminal cleavage/methylation domain-containing protein
LQQRNQNRSSGQRGFTIFELLGVVAIIGVITFLAFPSMRTFTGMSYATSAATRMTHTFNRARSQAKRRNRAIVADFALFRANGPGGQIDFLEARTNSCTGVAEQLQAGDDNATVYLHSIPVGGTIVPGYKGTNEKDVGLTGWKMGQGGQLAATRLKLCISPNGRTYVLSRDSAQSLDSWVEVSVQRYRAQGGGGAEVAGPPLRVLFPGFGPARLATN